MAYIDTVTQRNIQQDQQNRAMAQQNRENFRSMIESVTKIGLDIADTATTDEANRIYSAGSTGMTSEESQNALSRKDGNYLTTNDQIAPVYDEYWSNYLNNYEKDNGKIGFITRAKINNMIKKNKEMSLTKQSIANQQKELASIQNNAKDYVENVLTTYDDGGNSEEYMSDIMTRHSNYNELLETDDFLRMLEEQYKNEIALLNKSDDEIKAYNLAHPEDPISKNNISPSVTAKKIDAYLTLRNARYDKGNAAIDVNNKAFDYAAEEYYRITRHRANAFATLEADEAGHTWTLDGLTDELRKDMKSIADNGLAGYRRLTEDQLNEINTKAQKIISGEKINWSETNSKNYADMKIALASFESSANSDGILNRFYDMDSFNNFLTENHVDIAWLRENKPDEYLAYVNRITNNSAAKALYDVYGVLSRQNSDLTEEENLALVSEAEDIIANNPLCKLKVKQIFGDLNDVTDNYDLELTIEDLSWTAYTVSGGASVDLISSKVANAEQANFTAAANRLLELKLDASTEIDADSLYESLKKEFKMRDGSQYDTELKGLVDKNATEINHVVASANQDSAFSNYYADNFTAQNKVMKPSDLEAFRKEYDSNHPESPISDKKYQEWSDSINTAYAKSLGSEQKAADILAFDKKYWEYVSKNGSAEGFDSASALTEFDGRLTADDVLKYSESATSAAADNTLALKKYEFLEEISEKSSKEEILTLAKEKGLSESDSTVSSAIANANAYQKLHKKEEDKQTFRQFILEANGKEEQLTYKDMKDKADELGLDEVDLWNTVSGIDSYYLESIYDGLADGILENIDSINTMTDEEYASYYNGLSVAEKSALNILLMSGDKTSGIRIDVSGYVTSDDSGNNDNAYLKEIVKGLVKRDYAKQTSSESDIENGLGNVQSNPNTPASRFIADMVFKSSEAIVLSQFFLDPDLANMYGDIGAGVLASVSGDILSSLPGYRGVPLSMLTEKQKEEIYNAASAYVDITDADKKYLDSKADFTFEDFAKYVSSKYRDEKILPANDLYRQFGSLAYGNGTQTVKEYIEDLVEIRKNNSDLQFALQYIDMNNGHILDSVPAMEGFKWPRSMYIDANENYVNAFNAMLLLHPDERAGYLETIDSRYIASGDWEKLKSLANGDLNATLKNLGIDTINIEAKISNLVGDNVSESYKHDPLFQQIYADNVNKIIEDIASGKIPAGGYSEYFDSMASSVASEYAWYSVTGGYSKNALDSYDGFKVFSSFEDAAKVADNNPEAYGNIFESFAKYVASDPVQFLYQYQGGVAAECQPIINAVINGKGNYETINGTEAGPIYTMAQMLFGTDEKTISLFGISKTNKNNIQNSFCLSLALALEASGRPCNISATDFDKRNSLGTYARVGELISNLPDEVRSGVMYSAMQLFTMAHNQSVLRESSMPLDYVKGFSITSDGTFKNANGDVISFSKDGTASVSYSMATGEKPILKKDVFEAKASAETILSAIDPSLSTMNLSKSTGYNPEWVHNVGGVVEAINKANEVRFSLNAKGFNLPYLTISEQASSSRIGKTSTGFALTTSAELPDANDFAVSKFMSEYIPYAENGSYSGRIMTGADFKRNQMNSRRRNASVRTNYHSLY